ncbi:MAG: hypothetical protein WBQ17_17655 [Rhizomicrobium sp.]
MDDASVKPLAPVELLKHVRKAEPEGRFRLAQQIAEAVESPPSAAIVANENAALPETERVAPVFGQAEARARLLAYHEIFVFDRFASVAGLAASVAQATFQLNEIFAHSLRFDVAKELARVYTERWPKAHALSVILPMIGATDRPRDGFRNNPRHDVQTVRKPGAAVTFMVFCGIRHGFGIPLNILHHCYLARHKVNVIYVRDFSQNMYLSGIGSLGDIESTIRQLRERLARLGTKKLVCVGNSGGVFGALYYGELLKADELLLFAGPTSLEIGLQETERQAYPRLSELRQAGKIEWPDIPAIYRQNGTPVSLYFSADNRVDRMQAENLCGIPNVQLHTVPSRHHFMLDVLAQAGELDRAFSAAAEWNYPAEPSSPPPLSLGGIKRGVIRRLKRIWHPTS